ncbi:hypothetical protein [Salipiger bermudensis]|uniref:hypothetical protein n=1 Tax=Salipiger bermudensis TaxID=344736 RepID=UPI001A8D1A99|nr:hypothetical protein [Salipiger bermudensis]MBN9678217.1 hypothetical protein [Salipiger bermudensis]
MPNPHAKLTAEQLSKLAKEVGAAPSNWSSRDFRSNFLLWHEITGAETYKSKLTNAAESLYKLVQQDERVRANFGKPVHLKGRDRGKLDALPDNPKVGHRFA